jgi:hypothetical protein
MTETSEEALTMREQFLQAAADIKKAFEAVRPDLSYPAIDQVRAAYAQLIVLGTHIPDLVPGSPLPYGGMDDKDVSRAVHNAERGLASPAVTLDLVREMRRLRVELNAMGGPFGITDAAIRSMISEGFATAWRKGTDTPESAVIWKLIDTMDPEDWSAVISFVVNPLLQMLHQADGHPEPAQTDQET